MGQRIILNTVRDFIFEIEWEPCLMLMYFTALTLDKCLPNLSIYTACQNDCAKSFLSELHQICTGFDNRWQEDGKEAKVMQGALIFHLV